MTKLIYMLPAAKQLVNEPGCPPNRRPCLNYHGKHIGLNAFDRLSIAICSYEGSACLALEQEVHAKHLRSHNRMRHVAPSEEYDFSSSGMRSGNCRITGKIR